jgi:hypothetical protein
MVTKDQILAKVSSYDILNHYLKPYHNNGSLKAGKNISNPFLSEKQKTPSFNIYQSSANDEWHYHDFATGDQGSCFDLVMKLFRISFNEAVELINRDLSLSLDSYQSTTTATASINRSNSQFSVKRRPFTSSELEYWNKFGITSKVLQKYNVTALAEFTTNSKEGNPYTIKSGPEKFLFAYDHGDWMKLYKPLDEKKYRFQYLGAKTPNYKFGWDQLPQTGDLVFITGGEKDVMSLSAHGFAAFSLNSETASLDHSLVDELKLRFKNFIILYDNDPTGCRQADLLSVSHGIHKLTLPPLPDNGKDISDFFSSGGNVESLNEWISETLKKPLPEILDEGKFIYNAVELLALGNIEQHYLMSPIFPQKGTAVLAGKPDLGKSQLARQLCIQVASGVNDFLGFTITPVHNRALYISTEDSKESTTFLLNKQLSGLSQSPSENLRFIFADTLDQQEILEQLDAALTKAPVDIVVVDCFGDIFKGPDSNNNMAMRNTVKAFDKFAKKHNCLIIFVHHINKGAYNLMPGQEHIQGGAGLVQKVRLAIQLSEGDGSIRYFTVVKGNYCPKDFKENSLELDFSEDDFLFLYTGKKIPTRDLGMQVASEDKSEKYSEIKKLACEIFDGRLLSYSSFVEEYCKLTGKSVPTAKRVHRDLKKLEIIVEVNNLYKYQDLANSLPF